MSEKELVSIILAAGKGTRMRSSLPKVLHKILGKTILSRVIAAVQKINTHHNYVVVGHEAQLVEEEIKSFPNVSTVLQAQQLGTGHAVYQAYDQLKNYQGNVIVLYGDAPFIQPETLKDFVDTHQKSQAAVTFLTAFLDNPFGYGRIIRDSKDNLVNIVEEKDADESQKKIREVNGGLYCFDWSKIAESFKQLRNNNNQGEYYLPDIPIWAKENNLKVVTYLLENTDEIAGINSRAELAKATSLINTHHLKKLMEGGVTIIDPASTWISPETFIDNDSIVYPGTYMEGTNTIGHDCIIGPHTYIKGNVSIGNNTQVVMSTIGDSSIGENCTIGPFANIPLNSHIKDYVRIGNYVEVKNSSIESHTNVAHLSYIGNAMLGQEVNIGAGTITANFNAMTRTKNQTIIKDHCKIGSNTVLVAPVTVGSKSHVAAGSVITKDVPSGTLAIAREKQKNVEGWVEKRSHTLEVT